MESQTDARRMSIKTDEKRKISFSLQSGNKIDPSNIMYFGMDDHNINLCIIFNHSIFDATVFDRPKRRIGTEKDLNILEKNLQSLNFTVKSYENPKICAIKNVVKSVSDLDGKILNCIMFIVMTYGEESNNLWANDGQYVADDLTSPFIREDSMLGGIPKLFFIQSCRVKKKTSRVSQTDGKREKKTISMAANILVMHSTLEDCLSYRDKKQGSWFIQELANQLLESIKSDIDILHILTLVICNVTTKHKIPNDKSTPKIKQIPEFRSTLTKCLKFVKFEEVSNSKQNKINNLPEILRQPNSILQLPQTFQYPTKFSTFIDGMKKLIPKKISAMLSYPDSQTDTNINISQEDSVVLEAIPSTSFCANINPSLLPVSSTASYVINSPVIQPSSCHITTKEINVNNKLPLPQTLPTGETKSLRKTSIKSQKYLPKTHQEKTQLEIEQNIPNKIKQNTTVSTFQMVSSVFLHSKDEYRECVEELKKIKIIPESVTNLTHAIQLDFCTSDDYNKAISFLGSRNIPFHSSILPCLKFVIRGIPEKITEQEILKELRVLEYPVAKVERMMLKFTQIPLPSVIVDIKRSAMWEKKILNLSNILHLHVSVVSPYCENSQRNFGVSSFNSPENASHANNGFPEPFNFVRGHRKSRSVGYDCPSTSRTSPNPTIYRQRRASNETQNTNNSTASYQNSSIPRRSLQHQTIRCEESLHVTENRNNIPVIMMNQFTEYFEGQQKYLTELIVKLKSNE